MIQIAQIIFILSVLVILHEFGHYITAKWFKVRVEKFYLFMDAGFSLFKKKIGETEWGIGWLPLGGYVKLSGMIDESMDTEQMKEEPQPWEFRAKPAWQRLIIMLGGIIVNILLAWFIYTVMYTTVGKKYIATEVLQENGLAFGEVGEKAGFQNGDKIVAVDGKFKDEFKFMAMSILFSDEVIVDRRGEEVKINLSDEQKGEIIKKEGKGFVGARSDINKFFIDSISGDSDLKRFDRIIGANGNKFEFLDELTTFFKSNIKDSVTLNIKRDNKLVDLKVLVDTINGGVALSKNTFLNYNYDLKNSKINGIAKKSKADSIGLGFNDKVIAVNGHKVSDNISLKKRLSEIDVNESVVLTVERKGVNKDFNFKLDSNKRIGVSFKDNSNDEFIVVEKMSFGEALPSAISRSWELFVYNIQSLKLILKPKTGAYKQVKSPIGIARDLPDTWDWRFVWEFTAFFSIALAFMNLLPIPGLDGGHALFTIVEMITGKTMSDKTAGYVQTAGMIILLTLMALTFGKDIYQLIADKFFQ